MLKYISIILDISLETHFSQVHISTPMAKNHLTSITVDYIYIFIKLICMGL